MKKKYITIAIIATAIIGSTIGFYFLKKSIDTTTMNKPEYYKVDSVEKVFINGVLSPKESENIYIDATKGEVQEVHISDGQVVNVGDSLFTYNSTTIEAQIEQLDTQISTSEAQKQSLNKKLNTASDNLYQKQNQLSNLQSQVTQSRNQDVEEENSENNMESDVNDNLYTTIQQVMAEVQAYKEQVSAYEEQIESMNITLNSLYDQKNKLTEEKNFTVTAPIAGKIVLSSDEKNYSLPYIIIESEELIVKGTVSEKDYGKIKVDDEISVSIMSGNEVIDGKISNINNRPVSSSELALMQNTQASSSVSYYDVTITLNSQENLVNGFHSQGKVTLGDDTIKIPKTAIITEDNKSYVFINSDGILNKVEVTLGAEEEEYIVINSGVSSNDVVMKNPTSDTKEGTKVE